MARDENTNAVALILWIGLMAWVMYQGLKFFPASCATDPSIRILSPNYNDTWEE
jgi:hypothetical protein